MRVAEVRRTGALSTPPGDESVSSCLKVATQPAPRPCAGRCGAAARRGRCVASCSGSSAPAPAPSAAAPAGGRVPAGGRRRQIARRQRGAAAAAAAAAGGDSDRTAQRHHPWDQVNQRQTAIVGGVAKLRNDCDRFALPDSARPHLQANMTKQNPLTSYAALAAALFLAVCATQPDCTSARRRRRRRLRTGHVRRVAGAG